MDRSTKSAEPYAALRALFNGAFVCKDAGLVVHRRRAGRGLLL